MNQQSKTAMCRASAWFTTMMGWALAHPSIRGLNRHASPLVGNKAAVLALASQMKIPSPKTYITGDAELVRSLLDGTGEEWVAKPVDGGGYCETLKRAFASAPKHGSALAQPAIVQSRLDQPELRIYRIGDNFLSFKMSSPSLDYRERQDATVFVCDHPPQQSIHFLRLLTDRLSMDFAAADFKFDPTSEQYQLLEVNSSPMFAYFDAKVGGALCKAIVGTLAGV